jgi:Flp pilus assembly protein TadB
LPEVVASQRSKRKRRSPARHSRRAGSSTTRRELRAERQVSAERRRHSSSSLGALGERPRSLFGPVPVSELAILAGGIAFVVGMVRGGGPALYVGLIVLALGVVEFTAREHFSGYRSHTTLLAAIPSLAAATVLEVTLGTGDTRALLIAVAVPLFALLFYLLRRRFMVARQARLARPPAP